ncbi:MAG: DNA methyltransferase [Thermoplasmata archaeon]
MARRVGIEDDVLRAPDSRAGGAGAAGGWRGPTGASDAPPPTDALERELEGFRELGSPTVRRLTRAAGATGAPMLLPTFVNEFWTSRQRAASRLHEISYRACFKPQLPRFFLERLSAPGEVVYDPFMGRGTTLLESALLGRVPWGCDANPLASILIAPRLAPPALNRVAERLARIPLEGEDAVPSELLVFYHPETLREILALREYLLERERIGAIDGIDRWIRMVAVNRLTGHSPGFLSVYTLPPNQAVSVPAQRKINARRNQVPPRRALVRLILRKSAALLKGLGPGELRRLAAVAPSARLLSQNSESTPELPDGSVRLVVTSPPFLNVVDYVGDNWLRAWFCGIDLQRARLTVPPRLPAWEAAMTRTFRELGRLLRPDGHIAFEVGEIRGGSVPLEETVARCVDASGLSVRLILLNDQEFTKTSNCWGVTNRGKGTNTNRVVLVRPPAASA